MSAQSPAAPGGEGREQDRLLPVANIQRIMRRLLPADEKISKDAKEVLQESLSRRGVRFVTRRLDGAKLTPSTRRSEFVCFVTEEAAGRCAEEKRKTINGDDLIFALQNLGFEEYVPPLQSYLAQYRRVSKQKEKE